MSTPLTIRKPQGAPKGGIIVVQEAFGVNSHIEDLCDRIAAAGFVAVAPHLFHRTGDPVFAYDQFPEIIKHIEAMTMDGVYEDVDASIAALNAAGIKNTSIGIVGFCMGGTVTLHVCATREIGAGVGFYGGGIRGRWFFPSQLEAAPHLKAPWLGLYGDHDASIPVDDVEELRVALRSASVPTEIVRYADADHGFNCEERASYHAESAKDAWSRMHEWIADHLER
mgnify:FL=1